MNPSLLSKFGVKRKDRFLRLGGKSMIRRSLFLLILVLLGSAGVKPISAQQVCFQDKDGNLFCREYTGLPQGRASNDEDGGYIYGGQIARQLSPGAVNVQNLPTAITTTAATVPVTANLQKRTVSEMTEMLRSKDVKIRLESLSGIDRTLYLSRAYPRDPYWSKLIDSFIRVNIKPNKKLPNQPDIILALDIMARHYQIYNWSGIGGVWPCLDNCGKPIEPCYAYPEIDCDKQAAQQIINQIKEPPVEYIKPPVEKQVEIIIETPNIEPAVEIIPMPVKKNEPKNYKKGSEEKKVEIIKEREIILEKPIEVILPKTEPNSPLPSYKYVGKSEMETEEIIIETDSFLDRSFIHLEADTSQPIAVPSEEEVKEVEKIEIIIEKQKVIENTAIEDKKTDPTEVVYDEYSCSPRICKTRLGSVSSWTPVMRGAMQTLSTRNSGMGERLVAICDLKCIADDQRGHTEEEIMHFLGQYIRRRTPFTMTPENYRRKEMTEYIRADVQAGLHVLTARNRTKGLKEKIDLTGTDLRGVNLACKANLSDVSLKMSNLEGTDIRNATGAYDANMHPSFAKDGVFDWEDIYLSAIDVTTRLPRYLESPFFRAYKTPKVPEVPAGNFMVKSNDCTWWDASIVK